MFKKLLLIITLSLIYLIRPKQNSLVLKNMKKAENEDFQDFDSYFIYKNKVFAKISNAYTNLRINSVQKEEVCLYIRNMEISYD